MVTRGLWNLRVDGKWYRSFNPPRGRITSPNTPATLQAIRKIIQETSVNSWEPVPFPTPLHIDLDYVYNIDKDSGILTITQWDGVEGVLTRLVRQAKLSEVQDSSLATIEVILKTVEDFPIQHNTQHDQTQSSAALKVDIGTPTSLNELQFRLFTDLVLLWKFYFDDVASWSHEPFLKTLAIGILRIAAWDFEVLLDTDTAEIPIKFYSVPSWSVPSGNIFWFHGFLVTLYSATELVDNAILKAKSFLDKDQCTENHARVILISLSHVTLVEINGTCIMRSSTIPLVVNSSALHPSPGFRVLASILSSYSWNIRDHKETWEINLPTELFDRILKSLVPKDIMSFAQASFTVEKWYYSSLPQLNGLHVQSFDFSIPCCGKQFQPNIDSVYCSSCYVWSHKKCVGLACEIKEDGYICSECRQNKTCTILETGGIYGAYRKRKSRSGCQVAINGVRKTLHLRLGKPASRRPELWLIRGMSVPPKTINYTIYFSGVFSGLAYGIDEA
ncbi:hypothetical protein BDV38DRAFT_293399 [Aspergillus pseudotamarii]|uniref:Uncharacterized protein n=1 Tax=Aspergillus pseudotamarii TaxID=132259 RepID=A0A5N6T9H1_ASPPS|nr:uncharacterized protein BDV38DRAFT_293399 [Aspergillus pseudotamarii]KAE8142930.1 hypothetical protein BDV38DRAFT_293399 [Aspergillus pseudotamarii]